MKGFTIKSQCKNLMRDLKTEMSRLTTEYMKASSKDKPVLERQIAWKDKDYQRVSDLLN